jgi:O-antigen ligase
MKPVVHHEHRKPADVAQVLRGPAVGVLIAVFTVYLAFNAGGFFPGTTATATLAVCFLLVLGAMLVSRPFESFTPGLLVPLALLAGFAAWTLISATWSDAPGRALLEFDRALLYVLVLAFFGMLVPGHRRLEWGLRGFVVAAVAICGAAWITRVAADVWPIALDVQPERLSFPLTYWNALGLISTLALIACVHLSSGERQSRLVRVLGAAAMPLLASTLLLTFSRASLGLSVIGVVVYLALARPPRFLGTFLAAAVPTAVALYATYQADFLSSARFASPEGVAQGHDLALVVGLCVLAAAALRFLLLRMDGRLGSWRPPELGSRRAVEVGAGAAIVAIVLALALGAPSWVSGQYDRFVEGDVVGHNKDPRGRLTSAGNNGRIDQWDVALDAFAAEPTIGTGAGTYQLRWAQDRPYGYTVVDAHSLYLEVMGEFGIVGILLVGGAIVAILIGLALRVRGPDRHVYAAAFALSLTWAAHAGVDWDWEMPAVTLWMFALAGLGLSSPVRSGGRVGASLEPGRLARIVAAICIGVLAVTPTAISISQSRLERAIAAFRSDDCASAIDEALGSLDALKVRPEPYEVIGYCDARLGENRLAMLAMDNAVSRDPDSWETHYGLAIVRAAAGLDPLPQLYRAKQLNPFEDTVDDAIAGMSGKGPQEWKRRARVARLPI